MGIRPDHSDYIYHWIKTDDFIGHQYTDQESASDVMAEILDTGYLLGSSRFITGGQPCICFTESPKYFKADDQSRYQTFGFSFLKKRVFELGGRPVIYQPKNDLKFLDQSQHWRHVQYDPFAVNSGGTVGVDFTWEREWRLAEPEILILECEEIIVPNLHYEVLLHEFFNNRINNSGYENYCYTGYHYPSEPYATYITHDFMSRISRLT